MTTEPSDNHSFRFKWGSFELAAIGLPAVVTVLTVVVALAILRLLGLI